MCTTMNSLQDTLNYKEKKQDQKNIKVEVVFGNPQKGCRGSGICRVSTNFSANGVKDILKSCRKGYGQLNFLPKGQLRLDIYKYSLCNRVVRLHFSEGIFKMPESASFISGSSNERILTILPDQYQIIESKNYYSLVLDTMD